MSIAGSSILKDGTIATTGGTASALTSLGDSLTEHKAYLDGTDFLSRSEVSFSVKSPKVSVSAPNGYTQQRCVAIIKTPLVLDNGNTTINTFKIEFSSDVETTDAEKETLRVFAGQLIADSDFDDFWKHGSTA